MNRDLPIKTNTSVLVVEMEDNIFYARVHDDALEVSLLVFVACRALNIRSVSSLLSYLRVFPQPFADVLGWTLDEVKGEYHNLLNVLKGHVPDEMLEERVLPQGSFGAVKE